MFDLNQLLSDGLESSQRDLILATNKVSEIYGLSLSPEDAKELLAVRKDVLRDYDRVELDTSVIDKLVRALSPSPYVEQKDYVFLLSEFIEIFHYTKNQIDDYLSDDEIIEALSELFDQVSRGSVELLVGRELDAFIEEVWNEMLNNEILYGEGGKW